MPEAHDESLSSDEATANQWDRTIYTPAELVERERQDKLIRAWIDRHWKFGACPVCQTKEFTSGHLLEIPAYDPRIRDAKAVLPVFPVACNTCGYVLFFNALHAGIVQPLVIAHGAAHATATATVSFGGAAAGTVNIPNDEGSIPDDGSLRGEK